jgi:type I restriction enzyme R subunit
MPFLAESGVEETCLDYFSELGWQVAYGPNIASGEPHAERNSFRDVLLEGRLKDAVRLLNPELSSPAIDEVIAKLRRPESADVMAENWRAYSLLTGGVPIEQRGDNGEVRN